MPPSLATHSACVLLKTGKGILPQLALHLLGEAWGAGGRVAGEQSHVVSLAQDGVGQQKGGQAGRSEALIEPMSTRPRAQPGRNRSL